MASGDHKHIPTMMYVHGYPHLYLRRVTPRYSLTTGFQFEGERPNVSEGPEYRANPPMYTEYPHEEEHPILISQGTTLMNFLDRNGILKVLKQAIEKLYLRFEVRKLHREPIELFLEMLADLLPPEPRVVQLDKEIDDISDRVDSAFHACWTLQNYFRAYHFSEAIKYYGEYLYSDLETDDGYKPQPPTRPNTPVGPMFPHIWAADLRRKRRTRRSNFATSKRQVSFMDHPAIRTFVPISDTTEDEFNESLSNNMMDADKPTH